jgi:copper resistance protein C
MSPRSLSVPRLSLFVATLAVAGAMAWPAAASAHAALVKAEPGSRAVLQQAPEAVKLWFNEAVEAKQSRIWLEDAAGKEVPGCGAPEVKADDPRLISIRAPRLSPGAYFVKYRVLSRDGHVVEYGHRFRIESPPAAK